ncbi:conserved hypothetical protein [Beutenbergia cavernae DSM 12333]|uniref:Glycoside hydrolase 123-like N-terminal domain-containing protein n=1 Tax=Beutenbergia cavernae (strain ATCC BAA-8 / DSM 12333 / CCUG 43141 / JCM 11478 / NBRC 16432 / NCIMB 13614 / HKI 0122) TaxID=471853 RepID=C5C3D3_BEUC1|nr:glycoside hydrolase domain-containing protein [Beutenbergia cavernae]ACQ79832.1 conserved hypothetical protein [Beutenbergia cavernae DSM 12333]
MAHPGTDGHPELTCGIGEWDADAYGNHRIVVQVHETAPCVRVLVPWRRHDADHERVDTWVVAAGGRRVRNVVRGRIDADAGELAFEPIDGAGVYYVYYLPYSLTGSAHYPQGVYRTVTATADPAWVHRIGLRSPDEWPSLPIATAVGYEARSEIDSFAPMGFAATAAERRAIAERGQDAPFVLFPDDSRYPFGRGAYLPARWARAEPGAPLRLDADRGAFRTFQVGVWALRDLSDVEVELGGLPFPSRHLTGGGIDARGRRFTSALPTTAGTARSVWIGVEVPADADPGERSGRITITTAGHSQHVDVTFEVADRVVTDGGVATDPMARLGWLDSTTGHDDEVIAPFVPVRRDGDVLQILGRTVEVGPNGLPSGLGSSFTPEVTAVGHPRRELLAGPITLDTGTHVRWGPLAYEQPGPARVTWQLAGQGAGLRLEVDGELEADGCLQVRIVVHADADLRLDDVSLIVPLRRDVARYLMGLGEIGQSCPDSLDWAWQVATANQDALWLGDTNAGVQVSWRDQHYRRPLNTNYYTEQPLLEPESWSNGGSGGVRLRSDAEVRTLTAFSGPLELPAGGSRTFDVRLLLTPFKPLTPAQHLTERYFHAFDDPAAVADYGGNVVNLHHATPVNPYINDPMRAEAELRALVDEAHRRGQRVKVYDTVRELTRHVPELAALVALDHEVLAAGPGGGHPWLQEHLPGDHVPGWVAPNVDDVAVVTTGDSRWHNVYVRSVEHLAEHVGIDGLYLDDVAFDRTAMKRLRRVLARHRPDPLVDLHSANQFNASDGYASSANLYLELMPYLDRLWLGEYVDYEGTDPAYWLVEVSGIPFGLMGEMLQDGGNPWRGMVFGMTARAPAVDNRPLWTAWDRLGLTGMTMTGWWSADTPVLTDRDDVLATTFAGDGDAVIALASWASEPCEVSLALDGVLPGLPPDEMTISAPEIAGFQPAARYRIGEPIPIAPGRGRLLHLHAASDPAAARA